jgi:streptomycin 6-kinase
LVESTQPSPEKLALLEPWLRRWRLEPDGDAFTTKFFSVLMPVRQDGAPAMLKIAQGQEEREGAYLMEWWRGDGAARVLAHETPALLLERAMGEGSLAAMARGGRDDEASRILTAAVARLHAPRDLSRPTMLAPLPVWFRQLEPAAHRHGGVLAKSAAAARALLASPREETVLHGDIHHENVLDFGPRGWLAIDPKGLFGERAYDYLNLFCNPDIETAATPGRLRRQLGVVAQAAALEPARLLQWILAFAGLSSAWTLDDGGDAALTLAVAQIAAAEAQA